MTKYREIIRLTGLGFSQRNIMASCGVAQNTVVKVQKRARELNIAGTDHVDYRYQYHVVPNGVPGTSWLCCARVFPSLLEREMKVILDELISREAIRRTLKKSA